MDGRRLRSSRDDGHPGARGPPHLDRHSGLGAAMAPLRARPRCAVHMAPDSEQPADAGARGRPARARPLCARGRTDRRPPELVRHGRDARVVCEPCRPSCSARRTRPSSCSASTGTVSISSSCEIIRSSPHGFMRRARSRPQALADHIGACDLLIQPYPDGISSRRTSAMAGLALGIPVITTTGSLTESLWAETRARVTRQRRRFTARSRLKRCDCCRTTARAVTSGRGAVTSTASTSIFVTPSARSVAQPQKSRAHRHPELDGGHSWSRL